MWTDRYSVGSRVLDAQHKEILRLINELDYALATGDGGTARLKVLLNEVADYAITHFDTEERLLRSHGYPDTDSHMKSHRAYVQAAAEGIVAAMSDLRAVPEVLVFLRRWWLTHILEEDKQYAHIFSSAADDAAPAALAPASTA